MSEPCRFDPMDDIFFALLGAVLLGGGPNKHSHKCPSCAEVWSHDGAEIKTTEQNQAAHTCPKCGHHEDACYKKFRG